jgi:hypothetical protein
MSIIKLTAQDFVLKGRGGKGTLFINKSGNFLVFFKMDNCDGCEEFTPIFFNLPSVITHIPVGYGIINVSEYREVVAWSRESTTSITAVPSIILYVNGKPHARFNGTKNTKSIRSFIDKALAPMPQSGPVRQTSTAAQSSQFMTAGAQQGRGYAPPGGAYPRTPQFGTSTVPQGDGKYAALVTGEDDDSNNLLMPHSITPYNEPWGSMYKNLNT